MVFEIPKREQGAGVRGAIRRKRERGRPARCRRRPRRRPGARGCGGRGVRRCARGGGGPPPKAPLPPKPGESLLKLGEQKIKMVDPAPTFVGGRVFRVGSA